LLSSIVELQVLQTVQQLQPATRRLSHPRVGRQNMGIPVHSLISFRIRRWSGAAAARCRAETLEEIAQNHRYTVHSGHGLSRSVSFLSLAILVQEIATASCHMENFLFLYYIEIF
jgi:hypothetical protein